jgi:Family of unknown function (DUF6409)
MSNTASTAPTVTAGDIIAARPWVSGAEASPHAGIVLGAFGDPGDEYVTVWFPSRGAFERDQIGHAVQPILRVKVQAVTGTVTTWPAKRRESLGRKINAERIVGTSDLYQLLCRLAGQ